MNNRGAWDQKGSFEETLQALKIRRAFLQFRLEVIEELIRRTEAKNDESS